MDNADRGDVFSKETTGPDLKELPKEAVLEVIPAGVPRKRSMGYKRKAEKVKGT